MSLKQSAKSLSARALMAAERILRGRSVTPLPEAVTSILILEYMLPLGCCVHLTPLYEAIKHSRPELTLTVATRGLGLSLLRHHPFIDHLLETPDPLSSTLPAAQALAAQLAKLNLHPDCALTGASDQRTRIALLALLSGAGWRGGYTQAPQLYQRPFTIDPTLSQIDNNLRLAALAACPTHHLEPRVFFSHADAAAANALALEANPHAKPLLVFVTQNSGGQSTGWHNDRFAQVIRHAHNVLGFAIVYVGTSADTAAVEQLQLEADGIGTIVTGRTSITVLAALLAISDAAVSLDTGTAHIARAVGVPFAILGPSWQNPIEWLPLGLPQARILRGPDLSATPTNYKLDEITTDEVIAALDDLLRTYPPSPASRADRLQKSLSSIDHRAPQP